MGGSSEPAARRAARLGDDFMPSSAELWDFYRDELAKLGKPDPGPCPGGDTSFFHVASDAEAGWEAIAPYAMHEVNSYGEWMAEAGLEASVGGYESVADAETLRKTGQYRVHHPDQLVAELKEKGPTASLCFTR